MGVWHVGTGVVAVVVMLVLVKSVVVLMKVFATVFLTIHLISRRFVSLYLLRVVTPSQRLVSRPHSPIHSDTQTNYPFHSVIVTNLNLIPHNPPTSLAL
jgi:hypothetical protein